MNLATIRKQLEALENAPAREHREVTGTDIAKRVGHALSKRNLIGKPGFDVPPLTDRELRLCEIAANAHAKRELIQ